jgi:choline-sulfatase
MTSSRRRACGLFSMLALAVTAACGRGNALPPGVRPNALLVTIDTLRADHLGCYGRGGGVSPTLDALAGRGVRFATAVTHVPLTGPSHASILTGRNPLGHGFRDNGGYVLPAEVKTAAEGFKAAGYRTAGFVSGFPLDRRFGFDRGFDVYDDHLPRGNDRRRTPYVERFADATTDAVLRWLEAAAPATAAPWFLWVHYYDPHAPYEPPADLGERFRGVAYDGEIAFVDREIARLFRTLDERKLTDRTVVLVTADHGESLGEHGEMTHGLFVYDATLRVPWLMAGPGVPRGRVSSTVARGMDVLPTLADYAGVALAGTEGRSLRPAADGAAMEDAPAYAETLYPLREFGWAPLHAWRTAKYKLIEAPRPEIYDLEADPGETKNRAAEEAERRDGFKGKLDAAMARPAPSAAAEVDPETAERLAALGYLGGGPAAVAAAERSGSPLRDPKDGVRILPQLNRGTTTARTDPAGAIRELTAVLDQDPGLLMALRSRAVAYEAAGRHDLAIADLRKVEKLGVLGAEGGVVLGDNLRFAGRLDEALAVLERTARENPRFAQPWLSIAEIHIKQKKNAEAARDYERALKAAPDHIEALRGAGDLLLLEGKPDEAAARYARLLEIDAADAGAMTKLGVARMQTGRAPEAVALFRKAVEREPKSADALLYLAGALAAGGQPAEAVPFFERALAAGARTTMTLNGLGLTRLALGDRQGAADAFRESLSLDPKQPEITQALAQAGR